ncbi:MAG TPA: panthothenate synthetase [Thermoanaerobaculia bacterium]|nr:panthothenate synthetase [Thermoanaerobaculia bacterium]
MRFLLKVSFPHASFNEAVRKGTVNQTMNRIMEDAKPEAVYFVEMHGRRTAILIVNMKDSSGMPALAEPWFLQFGAEVEFHPAMVPDDLKSAGLEGIGKKWA